MSTGIFKGAVAGRVVLRKTNLDGDRQADLSAHGGPDKAVYVFGASAENRPEFEKRIQKYQAALKAAARQPGSK